MSNLQPTPIVDKNGKATTVHKRQDAAGGNSRIASTPAPVSAAGSFSAGLREATPGVPRLLDTPAAIALDNVEAPEGWTKFPDDGYEGAYMEGERGQRIAPDSTGDGWNATDDNGFDLGEFDTFEEAFAAVE